VIDDRHRCEFRSGKASRRCRNEGSARGVPAWNINEEPHVTVLCERHAFVADLMRFGAADRWRRQLEGRFPIVPALDQPTTKRGTR